MATVSGTYDGADMPPELANLVLRRGTPYPSGDAAYLHPSATPAPKDKASRISPVSLYGIAYTVAKGKTNPKFAHRIPGRTQEILEGLEDRSFPSKWWRTGTLIESRIEEWASECYHDPEHTENPYDPAALKTSWCRFPILMRSTPWPPAPDPAWLDQPGWTAQVDPDNWFEDQRFAQRVMVFQIQPNLYIPQPRPVVAHITGTITATSNHSGSPTWFTLALRGRASADNEANAVPPKAWPWAHNLLIPRDLELQESSGSWSQTRTLDLVVDLRRISGNSFAAETHPYTVSIAPMPTFGRYHGGSTAASVQANLTVHLYTPK